LPFPVQGTVLPPGLAQDLVSAAVFWEKVLNSSVGAPVRPSVKDCMPNKEMAKG
jgi:hypothetical protein